jgi:hypothetical protein
MYGQRVRPPVAMLWDGLVLFLHREYALEVGSRYNNYVVTNDKRRTLAKHRH